ncbi:MAG: hypothetical protein WCO56_06605 [Verrucomicrobiota bacterium]
MLGETDFSPVAEGIAAANGTATYEDTLPAAASYEYQAIAFPLQRG